MVYLLTLYNKKKVITMLANRLKDLRNKNDLKQSDIVNMLGVTQQVVARWENGKSEPDIKTLIWCTNYFEVSLDYLLSNNSITMLPLSRDQRKLLRDIESLTNDGRNLVRVMIKSLKVSPSAVVA